MGMHSQVVTDDSEWLNKCLESRNQKDIESIKKKNGRRRKKKGKKKTSCHLPASFVLSNEIQYTPTKWEESVVSD